MRPAIIKCRLCDKDFETDHVSVRYCSKECRKIADANNHKGASTEWHRRKHGTYEKWAKQLRNAGYFVFTRPQLEKILQ